MYGDPPSVRRWLGQVGVWLGVVGTSKLLVLSLLLLSSAPLDTLGRLVFHPLTRYPRAELVIVMIVIPMTINSFQFWITDMFLKQTLAQTPPASGEEYLHTALAGREESSYKGLDLDRPRFKRKKKKTVTWYTSLISMSPLSAPPQTYHQQEQSEEELDEDLAL